MTARANGDGSIYLRQDGRWSAAAYVLRPDGGRVRRQVYGRTRAEASQKLTALLSKTAAGIPLAVSLTGGHAHDFTQPLPLIDAIPAARESADGPPSPSGPAGRRG